MDTKNIISIHKFCSLYNIPLSFIEELSSFELIEFIEENDDLYIEQNRIKDLERIMHLRYDLNINPEGIDVIGHLLERIEQMEAEINRLQNRLAFYENNI